MSNATLLEPWLRAVAFLLVFVLMAAWEILAPRRRQALGRTVRWPNNIGLLVVDVMVLRIVAPGAATAAALAGEARGWGLLNALELPAWAIFLLGVVLLDLA